jgi:hypothetical protein
VARGARPARRDHRGAGRHGVSGIRRERIAVEPARTITKSVAFELSTSGLPATPGPAPVQRLATTEHPRMSTTRLARPQRTNRPKPANSLTQYNSMVRRPQPGLCQIRAQVGPIWPEQSRIHWSDARVQLRAGPLKIRPVCVRVAPGAPVRGPAPASVTRPRAASMRRRALSSWPAISFGLRPHPAPLRRAGDRRGGATRATRFPFPLVAVTSGQPRSARPQLSDTGVRAGQRVAWCTSFHTGNRVADVSAGAGWGEPDRRVGRTANEVGRRPGGLSGQLDVRESGHQLAHHLADLDTAEMRAEAEMRSASTEGQLIVGLRSTWLLPELAITARGPAGEILGQHRGMSEAWGRLGTDGATTTAGRVSTCQRNGYEG